MRDIIIVLVLAAAVAVLSSGCIYRGARVVEGSDIAVGLQVPGTDGSVQLQLFNYLSGFRLGVDQNAILKVKYTTAETNSFLYGTITTCVRKDINAEVHPCEAPAVAPAEEK